MPVDLFQLRAKETPPKKLLNIAGTLSEIIHKHKKIFIVNDSVEIAVSCGADGLHLGAEDIPVARAREIMADLIIGKTVHSLSELKQFKDEDLDYLSIGPVFKTKTKPELTALGPKKIKEISSYSDKLTFAIGGINLYNIGSLLESHMTNVAVTRDIILANDLENRVKNYKKCLKKAS